MFNKGNKISSKWNRGDHCSKVCMWSAYFWLHLQYTSLRKCQPTLLTQVVLCRDVSVEQEQGINDEARRLCVTSGQSGWGYCWAVSAVPVTCRTSCSNFLIHPSLVLFSCFAVLWISKDMIHRGMRTPMQWCRFPKKRNDKVGCVPPNKVDQ